MFHDSSFLFFSFSGIRIKKRFFIIYAVYQDLFFCIHSADVKSYARSVAVKCEVGPEELKQVLPTHVTNFCQVQASVPDGYACYAFPEGINGFASEEQRDASESRARSGGRCGKKKSGELKRGSRFVVLITALRYTYSRRPMKSNVNA